MLVVYDEISNKTLSNHLEQKLAGFLKMNEKKEEDHVENKKELDYKKIVKSPAAPGFSDNIFQSVETDNLIEKSD